jgi:mRNA-degrading endonuclease YafQ of YafQ-DinJ toxin-antitoxin module
MIIEYSPEFRRLFKKLSQELKLKALEKEKIFRIDYRDSRLKTHKLSGKLDGKQAFWIDYRVRIVFTKIKNDYIYFHSIGGHDIYK